MCDNNTVWINDTLVPAIIIRKKTELKLAKNMILKESIIKQFENDGAFLMTICYKLTIVLDVCGEEHRLPVFVKVGFILQNIYSNHKKKYLQHLEVIFFSPNSASNDKDKSE